MQKMHFKEQAPQLIDFHSEFLRYCVLTHFSYYKGHTAHCVITHVELQAHNDRPKV